MAECVIKGSEAVLFLLFGCLGLRGRSGLVRANFDQLISSVYLHHIAISFRIGTLDEWDAIGNFWQCYA